MGRRQPQDVSRQPGSSPPGPPPPGAPVRRRWPSRGGRFLLLVLGSLGLATELLYLLEPEYAYIPPLAKVLAPERGNQDQAFDVWGAANPARLCLWGNRPRV